MLCAITGHFLDCKMTFQGRPDLDTLPTVDQDILLIQSSHIYSQTLTGRFQQTLMEHRYTQTVALHYKHNKI